MAKVIFLIGGNLGDREQILKDSANYLEKDIGKVNQCSSIYETEPWGFEHELNFLNQVLAIETKLSPLEVLERTQSIEKIMGRIRKKNRYSERTIDIDILFYDSQIYHSDHLEIPHPRIQERMFALMPMNEILPDLVHPILNKTINELFNECQDKLEVKRFV
ncbi:2-amino-4-hydroxy-6-hydroxymethyldihydropteridine diphosphokinase [Ancylomarina longa]|uniref:2-amino-4-hydroxy-6-hydroxymethyldihydropteridine pyrophosphokinase n=1 Tax=Ancylomarina longa TaxID=2487017 RepID=A0A434AGN5_9BACT|nr:2-amino-4-hydroxy-6-hydroxymethyldihydropteridine diphosphokinase [Ancylomarina longa]RUT73534.1 2-amino-4-hydroxy-6-hydroxymethyldihydropteridine diphosphokinase [Ancylomarina longa]